jgi:hypothetical protein
LNLRRDWLDGRADVPPHLVVDFYTQPARYGAWLRARQLEMPHAQRWLAVWKAQGSPLGPHADGPLCVVYEEVLPGLDDADWARHWLLADGWSMGHLPCIESLAALVLLAQRAGVTVIGKELPSRELRRLQEGRALVAELEPKTRGRWHPEDLVMPPRQHDSAWLQAVRQAARRRLSDETHERWNYGKAIAQDALVAKALEAVKNAPSDAQDVAMTEAQAAECLGDVVRAAAQGRDISRKAVRAALRVGVKSDDAFMWLCRSRWAVPG